MPIPILYYIILYYTRLYYTILYYRVFGYVGFLWGATPLGNCAPHHRRILRVAKPQFGSGARQAPWWTPQWQVLSLALAIDSLINIDGWLVVEYSLAKGWDYDAGILNPEVHSSCTQARKMIDFTSSYFSFFFPLPFSGKTFLIRKKESPKFRRRLDCIPHSWRSGRMPCAPCAPGVHNVHPRASPCKTRASRAVGHGTAWFRR